MQRVMPPGVNNYGISQIVDAFTSGRLATAIMWAAMGGAMIPDAMEGMVEIVPPPGFRGHSAVVPCVQIYAEQRTRA